MAKSNLLNAKQRWELLGAVLKKPKLLTKQIINGCKSQGGLAKLELEEYGVSSISLNTLKASAKLAIEAQNGVDGWQQLDEMRQRINLLANEQAVAKSKKIKVTDEARIVELENILNKSNRERLRIIKGYFDLLRMIRELAKQDSALEARLNRHISSFSIKNLLMIDGGQHESK